MVLLIKSNRYPEEVVATYSIEALWTFVRIASIAANGSFSFRGIVTGNGREVTFLPGGDIGTICIYSADLKPLTEMMTSAETWLKGVSVCASQ